MEERQHYASYNSLTRKALVFGVPLMTLVGFSFAIIISAVIGLFIFPTWVACIVPALLCCCLFAIKLMCETRSNAMDDVVWIVKGLMLRLKHQSIVLVISSENKRKERINDFFRQYRK